jgi:hypothetical protein
MADEDLKPAEGDDQAGTDAGAEGEGGNADETGADSPYAELAQKVGWVPRDQFSGPPEAWKPADQFIIDGRDIQRETASRLKTVESQLSTIAKTSASLVEQQVNERVDALRAQHAEAVDAGDAPAALKIAQKIDTTLATATPANTAHRRKLRPSLNATRHGSTSPARNMRPLERVKSATRSPRRATLTTAPSSALPSSG